ncbi:MAG: hypothetical protein D6828_00530 [Nitrospirae bacterium]|nr:MAG: hypothetical protein D6828_00530 [Nitrospirota bacterium]
MSLLYVSAGLPKNVVALIEVAMRLTPTAHHGSEPPAKRHCDKSVFFLEKKNPIRAVKAK